MASVIDTRYERRRGQIEAYFDRTAADAGRDAMRATLLDWLPRDLRGARVLDAGCGTGMLAVEAARRGADVLAVDLSPTLLEHAAERLPHDLGGGRVSFRAGDMLDAALGEFDHVVAMDSLIHYTAADAVRAVRALAARTHRSLLFTFAPRTPALAVMHAVGRLIPHREHRAPAIEPVAETALRRLLGAQEDLRAWQAVRTRRVASGFYTSQALELTHR